MGKELIKITFNSKIKPVKPINDHFTLCKCYVMAIGKNANNTIISKKAVDDALPTLFNIPVVGHLYVDEDGDVRFGGHDVELVKTEDGSYAFKPLTVPYGVVPQDNNFYYEEVVEPSGEKNTYLVADIILWTGRYPEILDAIYSEDIYFAQSMEIMPSKKSKTSEGLDIQKFQFSALCLLGKSDDKEKNVEPCFKSAKVEPYQFSDVEGYWVEMFSEFKRQLAECYSAVDVVEGGKEKLNTETIKKILLEFGLAEDTVLSFEVAEDMTEDMLREKIKEVYSCGENNDAEPESPAENEPVISTETPDTVQAFTADNNGEQTKPAENEPIKFSVALTYEERYRALSEALQTFEVHDADNYLWYSLMDFDDTYVYSRYHFAGRNVKEEHGAIRIPYAFNDDKAVIDMSRNEKVKQVWLTKAEEDKISAERAQLAELVQYKADRLEEDKKHAYAAVIASFSDLGEFEEYKAVVKNAMSFESADALAEKLYAIRGKNAGNIGKKPLNQIRIPVGYEKKTTKVSEFDEFMARYLPQNENN